MTKKNRLTITQLYKETTLHVIISTDEMRVIIDSLVQASLSKSASDTCKVLIELHTVLVGDRFAVPAHVLKRIADQIKERHTRANVYPADQRALEIAESTQHEALSGPGVVKQKALCLDFLLSLPAEAGDDKE